MNLSELPIGQFAVIKSVQAEKKLRQHLLDLGLIPETTVKMVKFAPMGDPVELALRGYSLSLRKADAQRIEIEKIEKPIFRQPENTDNATLKKETAHPGLGEDGLFHSDKDAHPLPDNELLSFALIGNQNSGKTTLFNQLTGAKQHVGNFPGVTVDRKNGAIRHYPNTNITDLPGIYSMTAYSDEEKIAIDFLLDNKPHCIINIVDANNIERNLYLTMQLLSMDIPVIVALNMMDELANNGGSIDINAMEELLGVPVIPISASKNQGFDELVLHAFHIAHFQEKTQKQDF
ncbi:MAG: 50S ribosome-binding GTPase, partial [Neisseriaceae bacterium]|nr:50S ribosome-binding GTPase [Neisseriaceae bacterium]